MGDLQLYVLIWVSMALWLLGGFFALWCIINPEKLNPLVKEKFKRAKKKTPHKKNVTTIEKDISQDPHHR